MATVTGLTKDAMEAIRDGVIVDAEVVGNNLILTKFDASTIDAGNVRGPAGPVSYPAKVTSLPTSGLTDGDEVILQTSGMASVDLAWHCKYEASTSRWEVIGGSPLRATGAGTSTSSTSYVAVTGPSITVPVTGSYFPKFGFYGALFSATNGGSAEAVLRVNGTTGGATCRAACDGNVGADGGRYRSVAVANDAQVITATHVAELYGRALNVSGGSGSAHFAQMWLELMPKYLTT